MRIGDTQRRLLFMIPHSCLPVHVRVTILKVHADFLDATRRVHLIEEAGMF